MVVSWLFSMQFGLFLVVVFGVVWVLFCGWFWCCLGAVFGVV